MEASASTASAVSLICCQWASSDGRAECRSLADGAVSRAGAATVLPGEQLGGGGLEASAGGGRGLDQRLLRRLVSRHWARSE
jgi:hypothetical protein